MTEPDDEGIEVSLGDDGKVVIHAKCRPGEDPSKCAERVKFLVEALGQEGRVEVKPNDDPPQP
jgi:hypothetical protein